MDVVKERTTYIVEASFIDQDRSAVTPSSGTWRIDDITDGVITEVKDDTAFTPSGPTHEFEITPDENCILSLANQLEYRLVTVTFSYGASRKGAAEHRYCLENMRGI
jgi:hypothetical protein